MIVVLDPNEPPRLTDLERLDRLHAEVHGTLDAARAIGVGATSDPAFGNGFDAMIGHATSKGWLNDAGTHVRAHVELAG